MSDNSTTVTTFQLARGRLAIEHATSLRLADFFSVVSRNNPKRSFLFLSHLLGKHLPVSVDKLTHVHQQLAEEIPPLPTPVLFIGLAETATCLAQGVFEAWLNKNSKHGGNFTEEINRDSPPLGLPENGHCLYLHSSRYRVAGYAEPIYFTEAHSHAPAQWFYPPHDATQRAIFAAARSLVLIDDEITTANTLCNLAMACAEFLPHLRCVHLTALTDFMGTDCSQIATRLNLPVTKNSLMQASWQFIANNSTDQNSSAISDSNTYSSAVSATVDLDSATDHSTVNAAKITSPEAKHLSKSTATIDALNAQRDPQCAQADTPVVIADGGFGRCGITGKLVLANELAANLCAHYAKTDRILVLGSGEFMFPPFVLAQAIGKLGFAVDFFASTRSPIAIGGAINEVMTFADNYGEGIANYLYNWHDAAAKYQHIFLCHETPANANLRGPAQQIGARLIYFASPNEVLAQ